MLRLINLIQAFLVYKPLRRFGVIAPRKIVHPDFKEIPCIKHAFYTRNWGVSEQPHNSLSLGFGSGDKWDSVYKNKRIVAKNFGVSSDNLILMRQVSKTSVCKIENQNDIDKFIQCSPNKRPEVDGIATKLKNVVIGVTTADCLPILMVDEVNRVVGAAHAGWKPAKGGVIENVINIMKELGAEVKNIKACLGPCIRQKSYEVDKKFYDLFLKEDKKNAEFFIDSKKENHYMFDLAGYSIKRLKSAGIECIFDTGHDTYSEQVKFFSYRRNCHRGEKFQYGVQFSGICLR